MRATRSTAKPGSSSSRSSRTVKWRCAAAAGLRGGLQRRQGRPALPQRGVDVQGVEPVQEAAVGDARARSSRRRAARAAPLRAPRRGSADVLEDVEHRHGVGAAVRHRERLRVPVEHADPRNALAPRSRGGPGRARRRRRRGLGGRRPGWRPSRRRASSPRRGRAARPRAASGGPAPSGRQRRAAAGGPGPARTGGANASACASASGSVTLTAHLHRRMRAGARPAPVASSRSAPPSAPGAAARRRAISRAQRAWRGSSSTCRTAARSASGVHARAGTRTPAPTRVTRRALSGLSHDVGTSTIGTPASIEARIVALPPTVTTAAQRGSSAPWLIHRATCTFSGSGPRSALPLLPAGHDHLDRLAGERLGRRGEEERAGRRRACSR